MKTVGVLGGIGPQATMDFEQRFHHIARRLVPPDANRGYPPLLIHYHRTAPVLLDEDRRPRRPLEPDPAFLDAARWLGERADFLVITANAPHVMAGLLEKAAGRPVLSMVQLALDEALRRGWSTIGVLGLGEPAVYTSPLRQMGLQPETITGELRDRLDRAIFRLMEGRAGAADTAVALSAANTLRARPVDGVILGCTEIPLLLAEQAEAADLLNPMPLLADAAVRAALV